MGRSLADRSRFVNGQHGKSPFAPFVLRLRAGPSEPEQPRAGPTLRMSGAGGRVLAAIANRAPSSSTAGSARHFADLGRDLGSDLDPLAPRPSFGSEGQVEPVEHRADRIL